MGRQHLLFLAISSIFFAISAAPTVAARSQPSQLSAAVKLKLASQLSQLQRIKASKAFKAYKAYKAKKTSRQPIRASAAVARRSLAPSKLSAAAAAKPTPKPAPKRAPKTAPKTAPKPTPKPAPKTAPKPVKASPAKPSPPAKAAEQKGSVTKTPTISTPALSPPPPQLVRSVGGWKELSLPDSQATQLAGAAVQKYLVKVGVAASLGCKSAAKPQAASAPVISSGRQQIVAGLNMEVWISIKVKCSGAKDSTQQLHALGFFAPGGAAPAVSLLP